MTTFQKATLFDSDHEDDDNDKEPDMNPGQSSPTSSTSTLVINTENSYAEKYDDWRRKEELQKLKDKYGDNLDIMSEIDDDGDGNDDSGAGQSNSSNETSSDDDDESGESLTDDPFDDDFFNVYSALKNKDSKIYDKNFKFFTKDDNDDDSKNKESEKTIPKQKAEKLTLQKYHEKLIEEKKGITEEDETMLNNKSNDEQQQQQPEGYYEELYNIRKDIKDIFKEKCNPDDDDGDLFSIKHSDNIVKKKETKPKSLPEIWTNDEKLDEDEKFLKQYVLNRGYVPLTLDSNDNRLNRYKNVDSHFRIVDDDDNNEQKLSEENKPSVVENIRKNLDVPKFHYEEPDATIIKRYPRNIDSIRDTAVVNDKKSKRAEIRERKKLEKQQELKRLRKMKREEIEKKIETLKSISGNDRLDLKDIDLNVIIDDENDFDADKYDEKMKLLFGDDYYNNSDDSKPVFNYIPEIDDELYEEMNINDDNTKKRKKKNKREIKQHKDIMADDDIGLYDDIVGGDLATRFRYRMVEPNDFGLTDEEILLADDKELNRWCSLKKMTQYRSKEREQYERKVYQQKSQNLELKRKILKSVYNNDDDNNDNGDLMPTKKKKSLYPIAVDQLSNENDETNDKIVDNQLTNTNDDGDTVKIESTKKRKRRRKRNRANKTDSESKKSRKRRRTNKNSNPKDSNGKISEISGVSVQRLKAYGLSNRELKRMQK
ncbi:KRRI-Interacting protein 1 [Dermatophagoides pteronyssinus]|uniref:Protein KRI1 homolog n=1 Tax=Dermatophagoides pteronyssinus TaxID=6956 RepID=A0ABQ8IYW0_DERPT|nr:KRRI-Interacting protein 1 [Dermatophagoides pteronyssinus]